MLTEDRLRHYEKKAALLKALAHPIRLCIVTNLLERSCNVRHMQECLGLPQSTVSQHLALLRNQGIIHGERNGSEVVYRVVSQEAARIVRVLCSEGDDLT
ncbi:MAG: winged helix-turn-helix transcriptional regulator [Firmicutes bacterium]|nr:winged helix-turn-helix transcriptional regulator [Bacillota bacterium]